MQFSKNDIAELCFSLNAPLYCDCVGFSPSFEKNPFVVIGLYQLYENEMITKGGFCFYLIQDNKLKFCFEEILNAGLLDLKWVEFSNKEFLICGFNDGKIKIYEVNYENENSLKAKEIYEIPFDQGTKCLYVDVKICENDLWILCSCEVNFVCIMKFSKDMDLIFKEIINSHEFTPWVCCFSEETNNIFLSGGDDMKLILYDLRSEITEKRISQINKKTHTMGVTALKFKRNSPNNFYSGCYDQNLRLWDIRNIKNPIWEHYTDGGVWRIVEGKHTIGLGLSFANEFEILNCSLNDNKIESLGKLKGHDSLAYGIDIMKDDWLVTCSFYDKKVCLWKVNYNK